MMASKAGTHALWAGTISPHMASSDAAAMERRTVDLPVIEGVACERGEGVRGEVECSTEDLPVIEGVVCERGEGVRGEVERSTVDLPMIDKGWERKGCEHNCARARDQGFKVWEKAGTEAC